METERVAVKNQDGVDIDATRPTVVAAIAPAAPIPAPVATVAVAADDTDASSTKSKRRPGRPKTRLDTPYLPSVGIVKAPMKAGNIMEMVYNKPMLFRKMFALMNNFRVLTVRIAFTETGIEFTGNGHYEQELIQLTIQGKALTEYYIKEPMVRHAYLPDIDKITKTIGKSHNSVSIVIREEEERSRMHMIFHVPEYDADLPAQVKFSIPPQNPISEMKDDSAYPIRFEIDSAQFKSIINSFDNGLGANVMSVKKIGENALHLVPQKDGEKLSDGMSFKNNTKINLRSTIAAEDIFSSSVCIAYFRPLSAANISEKVIISADKFEPMTFTTFIDNVVAKEPGEDGMSIETHVARIKLLIKTEK